MNFHKIFYDEGSENGGVAVEDESKVIETDDGGEETPDDKEITGEEETPAEEKEVSESEEKSEDEEETYTTDWSKYVDQFEDLPDDIKESPDKLIEGFLNMKKGLADFKTLQTRDALLSQVDAALKLKGVIGGVDDILKDNVSVPLAKEAGAQPNKMPSDMVTSVDLVNEEIKQGRISSEYADDWRTRAAENDRLNYGRDKWINELRS
jgi:hypothetical protein